MTFETEEVKVATYISICWLDPLYFDYVGNYTLKKQKITSTEMPLYVTSQKHKIIIRSTRTKHHNLLLAF